MLGHIGTPAVDQIIDYVQAWEEDEEDYDAWEETTDDEEEGFNELWPGIFACGALAKIRHPKAFEFLISRLAHPDDDVRRTTLEQLLEYGDPEAIFVVRRILEDDYEDVVHAAKVTLVGLCDANGVKLGNLDELRYELAVKDDFTGEYIIGPEDEDWSWGDDLDDDEFEIEDYDIDSFDKKLVPLVKPPKIGRNDPCPCGSGKKYKKCCGKDSN